MTAKRRDSFRFTLLGPLIVLFAIFTVVPAGAEDSSKAHAAKEAMQDAFDSVESLAAGFLKALSASDRRAIGRMTLNRDEFERIVWPTLPAAQPGSNLTVDFVWNLFQVRSRSVLERLIAKHSGKAYTVSAVRFAGQKQDYSGFTIHRDVRVQDSAPDGVERELRLYASIIEVAGKFKLYGFKR